MENTRSDYYVFMNFDPEYARLLSQRKIGESSSELDLYLSRKHAEVLTSTLEPGTYRKLESLAIVDAFGVETTEDKANNLRSAKGVRVVEKNEVVVSQRKG